MKPIAALPPSPRVRGRTPIPASRLASRGYWTYRKKFGMDSKTLDALAMGANFVDARLDR